MHFKQFVILLPLFAVLALTGCDETGSLPSQPEGTQEQFDASATGVWNLVSAGSLMMATLLVTPDGKGIEYGVPGAGIVKTHLDFNLTAHRLKSDTLFFSDRVYTRLNPYFWESPCEYFPNEGFMGVYLLEGGIPMASRIEYNEDSEMVYVHRCLWSGATGFEQDIESYIVAPNEIKPYGSVRIWSYDPKAFERLSMDHSYYFEFVADTVISGNRFDLLHHYDYNYSGGGAYDDKWLAYIWHGCLDEAFFAKGLGMVRMQYAVDFIFGREHYKTRSYNWHKEIEVELVDWINPLETDEAEIIRRDFR